MKEDVGSRIESLWLDIKRGDLQAFRLLVSLYRKKLLLDAYCILSDVHDAEDVVQEVFINYWEVKHKLNVNSSLCGYLTRAVRNESNILVRKKETHSKRHNQYTYLLEYSISYNPLENTELGNQLRQAVNTLPNCQRNDFIDLYLNGKPQWIIAQEQNKSIQAVKNNVHRALKAIRVTLVTDED